MKQAKLFLTGSVMGLMLHSCIYINPNAEKKDSDTLTVTTTDSLAAYKPPVDSIKKPDSLLVVIDTLKTDSILIPNSKVNTRGVHPKQVVDFAQTLIGVPYRYASTDPKVGFDCSGFITYVFNHFKIIVPRSSIDFTNVGRTIPADSAKSGDLVLFTGTDSTEKFVGHMGLIVSNQDKQMQFIHSTSGKKYGVTITPMSDYYRGRYIKTIRIFPQNE
jgi:hypothetical protein